MVTMKSGKVVNLAFVGGNDEIDCIVCRVLIGCLLGRNMSNTMRRRL